MKFKNLQEVFNYLDKINDVNSMDYDLCKEASFDNVEWYEVILEEVLRLPEKPKRVIDVGSNLNQYGYLFANKGIEYVGIDISTTIPTECGILQPVITDKIKYIQSDYRKIKKYFKDDVIISCLCIGYLIDIEEVIGSKLIINDLDKNGKSLAKIINLERR